MAERRIDIDSYRARFGALAVRAYIGDYVTSDLHKLLADLVANSKDIAGDAWHDQLKLMRGQLRVHLAGTPNTDHDLHARAAEPGFRRQDRFYKDAIAGLTMLIVTRTVP